MRPTTRRQRNPRGEFVPVIENQVAVLDDQVAANTDEQRQIVSPFRNKTSLENLVTLKRWKITVTADRAQVLLWSFIMITRFLCMLSMTAFWLCGIMAIKTLPDWNGPVNLFQGILRRRAPGAAPPPVGEAAAVVAADTWWTDLFAPADVLNSYELRVGLAETGNANANLLFTCGTPVMVGHPLFWGAAMAIAFSSHHFLSFIHECIRRVHRATNVRRRSP